MNLENMLKDLLDDDRAYAAKVFAERELRKDPRNALCHMVVGVAYLKQGAYDPARVALTTTLKKRKNDDPISEASIYFALGRVECKEAKEFNEFFKPRVSRRIRKARAYLGKSADLDPKRECLKQLMDCFWDVREKRAEYGELYLSLYGPDRRVCEKLRSIYGRLMMEGDKTAMERMLSKIPEERWEPEQYQSECTACGATEGLHIHHKNKNPADNRIRNLTVLCGVCHKKVHMKVR